MRQVYIYRRKSGLIDLLIDKVDGAYSYRLKRGANFDTAVFTDFLTIPNTGFMGPTINDASNVTVHGNNKVRAIFNPSSYGITDDSVWWLKMAPLNHAGAEMSVTPALMILVPNLGGAYFPQLSVTGSAPNEPTIAGSLRIDFPKQMRDMRILSTAAIHVAFDVNGPEILLPGDPLPKDISRWSTHSSILVRGNGAVVPFSLVFTLAYTQ